MNFTMYRGQNIPLMTRRTNFEILLVFYSSDPFGKSYEMEFTKGASGKPPGRYYTSLGVIVCNAS
jgi:hypothetical protein